MAFAPRAGAFVYWANGRDGTIGRANLDGTGANPSFIAGATSPCGVAVDAGHVYWANDVESGTIERANLDGTGRKSLIGGATFPCGVAVDAGHVYWANVDGTIGRADLDGGNPRQDFITTANLLCGIAVDGAHLYWAGSDDGTIGRANLDGTGVNESFVTGASRPCGVALDAGHLYWANDAATGTIGRANLDGTGMNQSFIAGATFPCGVAVDTAHVYWANDLFGGTIGRANLDGGNPSQGFIGGASAPCGVAVDALTVTPMPPPTSPPSNEFTLGKPKLNERQGTARLAVTVPGPGELALSGNGVKPARTAVAGSANTVTAPGAVQLLIKAQAKTRIKLNETGKVAVKPRVTYTPTGGDPSTRSTKLKLEKR